MLRPGPGTTVCAGTAVSFTATPVNGGVSPLWQWTVNGAGVGAGGSTYSYTPLNNDVVTAQLTSDAACAIPPTASNSVTLTVVTTVTPTVTINATPATTIGRGQTVTLTAMSTNAGPSPSFQWSVNSAAVARATTSTYTAAFSSNATVSCSVTTGGMCDPAGAGQAEIVVSNVGVKTITAGDEIAIIPNPNNGAFMIKGILGSVNDQDVTVGNNRHARADSLQRQVHGRWRKTGSADTKLSHSLANGMYMLNLRSDSGNKVFHIVVEQ